MKSFKAKTILITISIFGVISACKHPLPTNLNNTAIEASNYPKEIATIMINKCATAGCHNATSYKAAGGLRLDTWEQLFEGGSNGAVVVPYTPVNSSLLYFINTDSSRGIVVAPTMPYNQSPLSDAEYTLIKDWIANGAPDKNGNIPFASNPDTRQKIYQTQQGCDWMGVIDAEKNIIMRYIKIGKLNRTEAPHFVKVDAQGVYAYTCFAKGEYIQKIDTRTDQVVADMYVGLGSWNVLYITPDGKKMAVSDLSGGKVKFINTELMQEIVDIPGMKEPHGITAANSAADTFIVTGQTGNYVYKITEKGYKKQISIDGSAPSNNSSRNPHEVIMTPDFSKYFLTCEFSHEVRIMDNYTDMVVKAIPVGKVPKEMAMSKTKPYLFVSCMEDDSQISSLFRGSIYVINYNTLEIVKRIDGTFFQPHGLAVDDKNGTFYIASTNANPNGPAPHHPSDCGGRNGYYQVYDLNTLEPVSSRRYEVTPDPYSMDTRFK